MTSTVVRRCLAAYIRRRGALANILLRWLFGNLNHRVQNSRRTSTTLHPPLCPSTDLIRQPAHRRVESDPLLHGFDGHVGTTAVLPPQRAEGGNMLRFTEIQASFSPDRSTLRTSRQAGYRRRIIAAVGLGERNRTGCSCRRAIVRRLSQVRAAQRPSSPSVPKCARQ